MPSKTARQCRRYRPPGAGLEPAAGLVTAAGSRTGTRLRPGRTGSLRRRLVSGALAFVACLGSAHADNADILRCRQFSEPMPRLACYDRIDASATAPPGEAKKPDAGSFGIVKKPADADIDTIESALATPLDGWRPNQVIALANGQQWQIADDSSGVMRTGLHKVRVRRGVLGTYYMEFDATNKSPRVKRVE